MVESTEPRGMRNETLREENREPERGGWKPPE